MSRKYYLFDTSTAKFLYQTNPNNPNLDTALTYLVTHNTLKEAVFYIPVFCIVELFNTYASYYHRLNTMNQITYDSIIAKIREHIRQQKLFQVYGITRYHNYNADSIYPVEHTFETEYSLTGLPASTPAKKISKKLIEIKRDPSLKRYHLSSFDILILSMGMELKKIYFEDTCILSHDQRLCKIAAQCKDMPPVFYTNRRDINTCIKAFQES